MPPSPDCLHDGAFECTTTIQYSEDAERVWVALSYVRCAQCHINFAWAGLNSGAVNPQEPVTSADGYELRAPIRPQPGGVVGLLQSAGLAHLLAEDGPRGE